MRTRSNRGYVTMNTQQTKRKRSRDSHQEPDDDQTKCSECNTTILTHTWGTQSKCITCYFIDRTSGGGENSTPVQSNPPINSSAKNTTSRSVLKRQKLSPLSSSPQSDQHLQQTPQPPPATSTHHTQQTPTPPPPPTSTYHQQTPLSPPPPPPTSSTHPKLQTPPPPPPPTSSTHHKLQTPPPPPTSTYPKQQTPPPPPPPTSSTHQQQTNPLPPPSTSTHHQHPQQTPQPPSPPHKLQTPPPPPPPTSSTHHQQQTILPPPPSSSAHHQQKAPTPTLSMASVKLEDRPPPSTSAHHQQKTLTPTLPKASVKLEHCFEVSSDFINSQNKLWQIMPQNPHFIPLQKYHPSVRKDMKRAFDLNFINLAENLQESVDRVDFDAKAGEYTWQLNTLEEMGYDVVKLKAKFDKLCSFSLKGKAKRDEIDETREKIRVIKAQESVRQRRIEDLKKELQQMEAGLIIENEEAETIKLVERRLSEETTNTLNEFKSVAKAPWT